MFTLIIVKLKKLLIISLLFPFLIGKVLTVFMNENLCELFAILVSIPYR